VNDIQEFPGQGTHFSILGPTHFCAS